MTQKNQDTLVLDLQYFPCIAYFVQWLKYPKVCIDIHENYEKQSYRNRCYIMLANKVACLSVPVVKGNRKQLYKDLQIDYDQKWLVQHWRSISSAYGKAPFYEYFADDFHNILHKRPRYLVDLNLELLTKCLKLLKMPESFDLSNNYINLNHTEGFREGRSAIHPKKGFQPDGQYGTFNYAQVFGKQFVPNLSVLDLLFCEGPNAGFILQKTLEMQPDTAPE
ncbi:WbqC family protein [uncultured Microscilla sp.]|uniref:WbqC family protein n=1 Tax=uncultured Microscilla sp. TaxID=432653 RepID=UPI0026119B35|nr:WbqC family protein [uncultured Microscilla sp.]